ncbi:MAG: flagellar export protein FliJ [Lachnospira sp.]
MAKFIYKMQNVLNIKERMETQAKTEYAEMTARLRTEEETMRNLIKKLKEYEEEAKRLASNKLDIVEIRRCNDAIRVTKEYINQQAVRVRIAQRNVEIAVDKLNVAMQERKIQEKLKENAFEEFKMELNAQESKEIDEIVSFNYNNREET